MSSNKGWRSKQISLSSEGEAMTWRELRGDEAGPTTCRKTREYGIVALGASDQAQVRADAERSIVRYQ
jgi:hypothetical protein